MSTRLAPSLLTAIVAMTAMLPPAAADQELSAPDDVAAPPAAAEVTGTGLASVVLVAGSGESHPGEADWVRVHYTGWTTDGKMFDSSVQRGQSMALPLNRVIDGWTEGVQLMVEGETRRFWIPQALAYGGRADRPQGMLVFDIELISIVDALVAPEHLMAPAPDAEVHKKGLASKVLKPGHGSRHPRASSSVTVHYTGWTTDGERFDTTALRGVPATFSLSGVIKGWTEGLQLMVEGEKRRFWIPQKLAYRGVDGKPRGMLIFDVELVAITVH
jgi:peptidylprolyl isomerase